MAATTACRTLFLFFLMLLANFIGGLASEARETPAGLLQAPSLPGPRSADDIVSLRIENSQSVGSDSQIVTFGQAFLPGDLPDGLRLLAAIESRSCALQIDAKTRYADKSVAWAVLSLAVPPLAAGAAVDVMLSRAANDAAAPAVLPLVTDDYDLTLVLSLHQKDGTTRVTRTDIHRLLPRAGAADQGDVWLYGPLAQERRITVALEPSLTALFDMRATADGHFLTDVTLQNDAIFSPSSHRVGYDLTLSSHDHGLARQDSVSQSPMQEWERIVSTDSDGAASPPPLHVIFDIAYLEKTGAVARYERSTGVDGTLLGRQLSALQPGADDPLGSALVARYQPATGARPDIGPTTAWAANWLVSQSEVALAIMLANEAAAAAIPIHATDDDGSLLTPATRPGFWLDRRNQGKPQTVAYDEIEKQSGWTPDPAHMPDLAYVTALTTGRHRALEQLQSQAAFDLLSIAPLFRADVSPLIGAQQRGIAWTIRDLANAAYLTPQRDPLKRTFARQLAMILHNLLRHYAQGSAGAAQGQLQGYVMGAFDSNQVAPWEQDYLAIALGQAAAQGVPDAGLLLAWMNNFLAGLYLNGANGYNPLRGSAYWLTIGTGSVQSATLQSLTDWRALDQANFAQQPPPTALTGYPEDSIGGFSTIAKAALATAWNVTHAPMDLAAYAFITQHTAFLILDRRGYAASQTWNITPVFNDGHQLENSEVAWGQGGATTATTAHSLLAAVSGDNQLQAGDKDSILIGGAGIDRLTGGDGDDFLFAGTGPQTLCGGAGKNYLEGHLNGGANADRFVFKMADNAQDRIADFQPDLDIIEIDRDGATTTAAEILATATGNDAGDLVLHLSPRHAVTVLGVKAGQLDTRSFEMR